MTLPDSEGKQLYDLGWIQGSYIACESLPADLKSSCLSGSPIMHQELRDTLESGRNILITTSQACDIVSNNDSDIEFVVARRYRGSNHQPHPFNLHGQSSRFWDLQIDGWWHKAEAQKIVFADKSKLLAETRSGNLAPLHLDPAQLEVLPRWRANRYFRVALPSSFDQKVRPLVRESQLLTGLHHCSSLYLNLDPFEESENYSVRLFGLQKRGASPDTYDELRDAVSHILEFLDNTQGITCPYLHDEENPIFQGISPAMRRFELDIAARDNFVRWNLDYISMGEGDFEGIDDDD